MVMDFQVVVLAGGTSPNLDPLVSKELPKPLLSVADRPLLSYVLELLESSGLKNLIVVVEGQDASQRVGGWISSAYADRLNVEVASVPEDVGSAGALRAIAPRLSANDIMVVSGDLVSNVPPAAIAATHRRHDAIVTVLLCSIPPTGPSETGSSGGKDKVKKRWHNSVGLDPSRQFLLHVASVSEAGKVIRIQENIVKQLARWRAEPILWMPIYKHLKGITCSLSFPLRIYCLHIVFISSLSSISITSILFCQVYFTRNFGSKPMFRSIRQDIVPYLVRSQLRSEVSSNGGSQMEDNLSDKLSSHNIQNRFSLHQACSPFSFQDFQSMSIKNHGQHAKGSITPMIARTHLCCAYIADKSKYCARLDSIKAFSDINRDVVGEASYLSGYSFSAQNNIIHSSAKLGAKTTVGPQCLLAEGSQMGDKCSVKRSVIGRHCRIGSNVKGSVICSNAQLHERAVLKDCQVGAGYVVTAGSEHKAESLTKK